MQEEVKTNITAGTTEPRIGTMEDPTTAEALSGYETEKPFILVADDNETFLLFVKKILVTNGYECITTTSPDIAARIAGEKKPALILCDINFGIGKSTAMDVFKSIRMKNIEAPFIIVSAFIQQEFKDRAEELGVTGYLIKPIDANQLIAAIKKHIVL